MIGKVEQWSNADQGAFLRSVFRRRWLFGLERMGVTTVGELRAMSEEQLRAIPNFGPKTVADISSALVDGRLRAEDPLACLALPRARPISARDREIVRTRQAGETLAAITRRFGISSTRVEQILEREGW